MVVDEGCNGCGTVVERLWNGRGTVVEWLSAPTVEHVADGTDHEKLVSDADERCLRINQGSGAYTRALYGST
jgi:hypothetical protein